MKFVLHLEHVRYFQNHGDILFENLVPQGVCLSLESKLKEFVHRVSKGKLDMRLRENMFRSVPDVLTVMKRYRLASFAAELIHRPKLSLAKDFWVGAEEPLPVVREDCQLFLYLSGERAGQGVFFTDVCPEITLTPHSEETGLFCLFSSTGFPIS